MNFRDLVTRLDLIENAGLTLATVKSAEDAARDKAATEKTKGGWTGFTSWDPKTAGNIAVALIAQQNKLEGLFNSDGDFVVARQQQTADNGDIVVAGIPGDEATVKTFKKSGNKITLVPSNPTMEPMVFTSDEVSVFGKVVTVMRRL